MKKNKTILIIFVLITVLFQASCDKYLDIQPKGVRLLATVEDFELWLESDFLQTQVPSELSYLADLKDVTTITSPPRMGPDWVYTWQKQFSEDLQATPVFWAHLYKVIYYYNTAIIDIKDATGGTQEQRQNIRAEGLLGRAFTYLQLVNLYGKQYNEATAKTDLAVPFVISNDLSEPTPNRSTVQEIYDYIIADLTEAIPLLPKNNDNNRFRGSVAAAYSVLARTYLFMGNYPQAMRNAKLALENGPNTIVDYSNLNNVENTPNLKRRPDAIFARYSTGRGSMQFPTLELLKSYNRNDKRLNLFFSNIPVMPQLGGYVFVKRGVTMYWPGGLTMRGQYVYPNCGTSVAEMRLIIAEAAARANDLTTASEELHQVRKCRFPAHAYTKFESTNQETMLKEVLKERIFEFPFHGMRWFDMKRLDAQGRMPDVVRYNIDNQPVATLPAGSKKYTLQIPMQVLYFNPNWEQNPWD